MKKSSNRFIALLLLSLILLAFIGSNAYKQIEQLRHSSELIAHKLRVQADIYRLFSHYTLTQSNAFESILRLDRLNPESLRDSKKNSDNIISSLKTMTIDNPTQQGYLKDVETMQKNLYTALLNLFETANNSTISKTDWNGFVIPISKDIEQLKNLRDAIVSEEELAIKIQKDEYDASVFFTPLVMLSLGLFALSIFLFSFWQINKERKKTEKTQLFLSNVLSTTNNVISYFTPVRNKQDEIIDFDIIFNNDNIENVLGKSNAILKGKLMSKELPIHFENGVFEHFVACFENNETHTFERNYNFNNHDFRFKTTAIKMNDGVLTTSFDTLSAFQSSEKLKQAKNQLETQNLLLLDNRAFLNNIFKSISNLVMNFEAVRNATGKIIDFKILFINDAIIDVTGDIPAEVKNKRASEIYPGIFDNEVFENMVRCIEEEKQVDYEVEYERDEKKTWFQATAIKLNDGVTVTTRDVTSERQHAATLSKLNSKLEIQNSIFKDAEEITNVGSYVWDFQTTIAVISDNFYRILGYEPNAFVVTIEAFKKFVHPDDLDRYNQLTRETFENGSTNIHTYRIITKTGKVKHLYVNGQSETRDGRAISIGVVQDITDQVRSDEKLKAKNEALKRSNAELESFNRIASHDLQEPLRKIQMFISRLSKKELDALSDRGKMYINKIDNSANRMQNLINHLLAYSRINNRKKDFVNVALNKTVAKVMDDLEELIDETNVNIVVDELPTVSAIPFQMEQLFNNLIANAIKYRSTTEPSKIVIECKKIPRSKITAKFDKKRKRYYRISIMDNGIGFDRENAEKIFGLFERLHQKNEYQGTGIGLAICKKIALNHNGFIVADGEKGKGATFCLFLPA